MCLRYNFFLLIYLKAAATTISSTAFYLIKININFIIRIIAEFQKNYNPPKRFLLL